MSKLTDYEYVIRVVTSEYKNVTIVCKNATEAMSQFKKELKKDHRSVGLSARLK